MGRLSIEPRMLTQAQAAGYCGLSQPVFARECPVPPVAFGDRRTLRYDRLDIDAWLDARKGPAPRIKSIDQILAEFDECPAERSRP